MKTILLALAATSLMVTGTVMGGPLPSLPNSILYTFEPPEFTGATPLMNKAPASGAADFRASFTVPTGGSFTVMDIGWLNPSFSGSGLMDTVFPGDSLRVSLNTPIVSISMPFALKSPGYLEFKNEFGTIIAPTTNYQLGHLAVESALPFTEFELRGFIDAETPVELAIDNLSMTLVPEPSALGLCLLGFGMLLVRRSR